MLPITKQDNEWYRIILQLTMDAAIPSRTILNCERVLFPSSHYVCRDVLAYQGQRLVDNHSARSTLNLLECLAMIPVQAYISLQ